MPIDATLFNDVMTILARHVTSQAEPREQPAPVTAVTMSNVADFMDNVSLAEQQLTGAEQRATLRQDAADTIGTVSATMTAINEVMRTPTKDRSARFPPEGDVEPLQGGAKDETARLRDRALRAPAHGRDCVKTEFDIEDDEPEEPAPAARRPKTPAPQEAQPPAPAVAVGSPPLSEEEHAAAAAAEAVLVGRAERTARFQRTFVVSRVDPETGRRERIIQQVKDTGMEAAGAVRRHEQTSPRALKRTRTLAPAAEA